MTGLAVASCVGGRPRSACTVLISSGCGIASYLRLEVISVFVVMNPSVVDLVERPWRGASQHSKPVGVVDKKIGLALGALVVARLKPIHGTEVPSANPVS